MASMAASTSTPATGGRGGREGGSRRRCAQWSAGPSREPRSTWAPASSPPYASYEEADWEACVAFEEDKRQLTVTMAGRSMADNDMEQWCSWFIAHLGRSVGRQSGQLVAKEVNFAENQLTGIGVRCLLQTLSDVQVVVLALKLHHNQLADGSGVADFISGCKGTMQELHLSHNELDTAASAEIILAAAAAIDTSGAFCYPRQAGARGASPLWLRLEQNYVDQGLLAEHVELAFARMHRPGRVLCNAGSKGCTPHCCVRHHRDSPVIHAKQMANQRWRLPIREEQVRPPVQEEEAREEEVSLPGHEENEAQACAVEAPAPELGASPPDEICKPGQAASCDDAAGSTSSEASVRTPSTASHISAVPELSSRGSAADASFVCTNESNDPHEADDKSHPVLAKVLRWDATAGRWVTDYIEIPAETESERKRAIHEERAAQELKDLIGIGLRPRNGPEQQRAHHQQHYGAHQRGPPADYGHQPFRRGLKPRPPHRWCNNNWNPAPRWNAGGDRRRWSPTA